MIIALPILKELSNKRKCNLYLQVGKPLEKHIKGYKHEGDEIYMSEKMVNMVLPLLKNQNYINKVEKYNNQLVDVDLNLFRKIPMNFNLDEVRWYFHLTGIHTDLSKQYLFANEHPSISEKLFTSQKPCFFLVTGTHLMAISFSKKRSCSKPSILSSLPSPKLVYFSKAYDL